jgi:hypothetical protein
MMVSQMSLTETTDSPQHLQLQHCPSIAHPGNKKGIAIFRKFLVFGSLGRTQMVGN